MLPDRHQSNNKWRIEVYQKMMSSLKHLFLNVLPFPHSFADGDQANTFWPLRQLEHHALAAIQRHLQTYFKEEVIFC